MSLSDLKRKGSKKKQRELSIEAFIDDATAYAKGQSLLEKPKTPKGVSGNRGRNYKKATFTLAPTNIEHLSELAEETGIAKSKLIRIFIEHAMSGSNKSLEQLIEENKNS